MYQSLDVRWAWSASLRELRDEYQRRLDKWNGLDQAPQGDLLLLMEQIDKRMSVINVCELLGRLNG